MTLVCEHVKANADTGGRSVRGPVPNGTLKADVLDQGSGAAAGAQQNKPEALWDRRAVFKSMRVVPGTEQLRLSYID